MNLFYQPKFSELNPLLDEEESFHAVKVLRLKTGDHVQVTDGAGNIFHCEVLRTSGRTCSLKILSYQYFSKPKHNIHIALAPTKSSDRTEWFVEKATEIGIQKISFINTQHAERNKISLDRMARVAVAAMKQSKQVWLPEIQGLVPFEKIVLFSADQKFIATALDKELAPLHSKATKNKSYIVLIGPEGDFSQHEMNEASAAGFSSITLGPNTLRTETAGVAACHTLNLIQYI